MDLLFGLNKSLGCTLIIVTHDPDIAKQTSMRISIKDGKIENIEKGRK
jgi:predicted ABC-type transport system involved in lysophospholipase L1 biosynthesis ATPase subunit